MIIPRWPEFESQLARLDAVKKVEEKRKKAKEEEEARNKEKNEKEVPEVKEVLALGVGSEGAVLAQGSAVVAEPLPSTSVSTSAGGVDTAKGGSSGSLMEQLAARGIVVIQKEVAKDCNNMGQMNMGESKDGEESTDDEEEDEEEEEDSGEEDDLEEEEEGGDEEEDYDEEALLIPG